MYSNYRSLEAAVFFMVHAEHEALLCSQVFSICKLNVLTTELQAPDARGIYITPHSKEYSRMQRLQLEVFQGLRRISMMLEKTEEINLASISMCNSQLDFH